MRFLILGISLLFLAGCSPRVFQSTSIDTVTAKHTTIAVIKPEVVYKNERPNKKDWKRVPNREVLSNNFQSGIVAWINEQNQRGLINIIPLDASTVNRMMDGVENRDYQELARKLGVDAVMVSRIDYDTRIDHSPRLMSRNSLDDGSRSRIYLNLFSFEEGLIRSYEQFALGSSEKKSYDTMVVDLLRDARRSIPYRAK